jgi:hypothetical protein
MTKRQTRATDTTDAKQSHSSKYTSEEISSANTLVSLMDSSGDQTSDAPVVIAKDLDTHEEIISGDKSDSLPSLDSISSGDLLNAHEIKQRSVGSETPKSDTSPPKCQPSVAATATASAAHPTHPSMAAAANHQPVYNGAPAYGYYPMDPSMAYAQYYPMYSMAGNYGPQMAPTQMHPNFAPMAPMVPQMHGQPAMNPGDRQCPYCLATSGAQHIRHKLN